MTAAKIIVLNNSCDCKLFLVLPRVRREVDGLVKKGLSQRIPHTSDRRSILCATTEAGRTMADALDEPIDRSDRELTRGLAVAEVKQLAELLCRVGNHDG